MFQLLRGLVAQLRGKKPEAGGRGANMHDDQLKPVAEAPPVKGVYRVQPGGYDELLAADGQLRQQWQHWFTAFSLWTESYRKDQAEQLNRFVRETGIAYDLFSDPDNSGQPWFIDLAPLIISADEWSWLRTALTQRARLFEAINADLYGPQTLLKEGYIPAQLIYSDPSFLRPLCGMEDRAPSLMFFAADLAKGVDGTWRVVDNHAETPAGVGFALANRIVSTHAQGSLFRQSNALRLAPYFQRLQKALVHRSGVDDPLIAVLTPGPEHRDYFSHSYLARYLGYVLVEGGDLVVQNNQVSLKTLEGLKPINVLLRSIEGAMADPLELNPAGLSGTAGMVQAARHGSTRIVNQLGTAIVENRGLAAYLPAISKYLLGEDLLLHEAPRWWLGDPAIWDYVLDNLPNLMVSDAHEGSGRPGEARRSTDGSRVTEEAKEKLRQRMQLYGASMVAEQKTGYATAPSWTGESLEARPYAVRFYMSKNNDDFEVMPGGLSMTVPADANIGLRSPERLTRDVWVVSDSQVGPFESLWQGADATIGYMRVGRALQSRVADNLFWLGCNAERMEWLLRVCRQALSRLEEDSGPEEDADTVVGALNILLNKDPAAPYAKTGFGTDNEIEILVSTLLYGRDRANGFQATLSHLQRIAGRTRDRLSLEAWRTLNRFFTDKRWRNDPGFQHTGQVIDLLDHGLTTLAAYSGMAMENMTRNFGWRFLDMGRRVERAQNIAELIREMAAHQAGEAVSSQRLMFVLEVADSFITYRSRYRIGPVLSAVIDLLLLDETNPRALAFQLVALTEHINKLPKELSEGRRSRENLLILDLLSQLQLANIEDLAKAELNDDGEMPLSVLLAQYDKKFPELIEILTQRYFTHTAERAQRI